MAKRSSTQNEPKGPSLLRVPIEDARTRLQAQLEKGTALLQIAMPTEDKFNAVQREYFSWGEFNETLIQRLFTTDQEFNDYRGISFGSYSDNWSEDARRLKDEIERDVRKIDSLVARLEIYELSPEIARAPTVVKPTKEEVGQPGGKQVFVVHGRDEAVKTAVARVIERLGLQPIILGEQADRGRTIIQKFMDHAEEAVFTVVVLTPDDVGRLATADTPQPRARQNVILELGYFLAKLGPERVLALHSGGVELPTDIAGRLFVPYDGADGVWRFRLAQELKAAGVKVDANRLLGS